MRRISANQGYQYYTVSHRQVLKAKRDRQIRRQLAMLFVVCTIVGLVLGLFVAPSVKTDAASSYETEMVYQSIQVSNQMTLSDIEQEYNTEAELTKQEYIEKVKQINHINDTNIIHQGAYLTIPVYTEL